jgi:RHS repeat-associated protein
MSVEYTYDGKQRLTCKAHNGQPAAIYVYDGVDNLLSMRDDSGETQFSYNADGRVTSILYPDGKILRQEYDEAGNLVKIIYPNGLEVNYSYNQREQISRVWWNNQEVLLSYDPAGNLTREERSNGVISVYSFAENEYIQEIKHTRGEKVIASRYLRRDAAGKITAVSGVMPIQPGFTSQSITGSYNRANQVTHLAGEAYHYDADGNLTDIEGKAWQAEYDSENKLVRLSRGDGSWRFVYNGLEQRVGAKTENESQVFYHDKEGRLLCEGGESGQFTACYIYFEDLLGARLISTGESQFYLFDQVGNTIALVNEPGDVCAAYACDPFGLSAGRLEKTHRNPYTFAGRFGVRDEGDGLYYMRYRYYDAHIARFIQKDPMGIVSDSNLYRYTRNNPVNAVDPDGTFGVLEVCLAGLILGAFCAAGYNAAQQVKHTSFGIATQAMRNPHNPNVSPSQGRSSAQRTLEVFGGEPIKTAASLTPGLSSGTAAIRAANEIREGNHVDAALTGVGAGHPNKNVRTGASIVKRVKKIASTCIDARRR